MINITNFKSLILFIILTLAYPFAFAGGGDAGGGVGVRCNGKLLTLERYEAQELGIKLINNPLTLEDAKKVFHNVLKDRVNPQATIDEVEQIFKFLEVPEVLDIKHKIYMKKVAFIPLTHDWGKIRSHNGTLRPNCYYEQIVKWEDNFDSKGSEQIIVNFSKLSELDFLDIFIIIFHEFSYRMRREAGEKTSYFTRENIIDLLSLKPVESSIVDSNNSVVSCKIKLQAEDSSLLYDLTEEDDESKRLNLLSELVKSEIKKSSDYIISDDVPLVLKVKISNNSFILSPNYPWSFKLTGTLGESKYNGIGESYLTSSAVKLSIQNLIKSLPKCK